MSKFEQFGKTVVDIECAAIDRLKQAINADFAQACQSLLACHGRVIVIGMGKSGHIAHKLAATFASTGTPAFYVHPGEAGHGDLGMITKDDIAIAISSSGNTDEILMILPLIEKLAIPLIALTGNAQSSLAQAADIHLDVAVEKEACPHNLAPSASTTAALVMGDALAIALLQARGFSREDFALTHPAGSLGKRLLLQVKQIMHQGAAIPKLLPTASIRAALIEMTAKSLGLTAVVDDDNYLLGVFTDGDLRRVLEKEMALARTPIEQVMTKNCKTIYADTLAAEAFDLMETHQIFSLLVVDQQQRLIGALNMHDLFRAGVNKK